jgi:hypothetical protein
MAHHMPETRNEASAAALRALLHVSSAHLRGAVSPLLLARASVVCRAWREECALPDLNRCLLFDEPAPISALLAALERSASFVEEVIMVQLLHAEQTLVAPLVPTRYVRLKTIAVGAVSEETAVSFPVLALARAAPQLVVVSFGEANVLLSRIAAAAKVADNWASCELDNRKGCLLLADGRSPITLVDDRMRGLLTPERCVARFGEVSLLLSSILEGRISLVAVMVRLLGGGHIMAQTLEDGSPLHGLMAFAKCPPGAASVRRLAVSLMLSLALASQHEREEVAEFAPPAAWLRECNADHFQSLELLAGREGADFILHGNATHARRVFRLRLVLTRLVWLVRHLPFGVFTVVRSMFTGISGLLSLTILIVGKMIMLSLIFLSLTMLLGVLLALHVSAVLVTLLIVVLCTPLMFISWLLACSLELPTYG